MADKKRLIDANALAKALESENIRIAVDKGKMFRLIDNAPTVDAVEVVRCKDCEHYVDGPYDNGDMMCDNWGEWIFPHEDDFCSYGERKDNGKE